MQNFPCQLPGWNIPLQSFLCQISQARLRLTTFQRKNLSYNFLVPNVVLRLSHSNVVFQISCAKACLMTLPCKTSCYNFSRQNFVLQLFRAKVRLTTSPCQTFFVNFPIQSPSFKFPVQNFIAQHSCAKLRLVTSLCQTVSYNFSRAKLRHTTFPGKTLCSNYPVQNFVFVLWLSRAKLCLKTSWCKISCYNCKRTQTVVLCVPVPAISNFWRANSLRARPAAQDEPGLV